MHLQEITPANYEAAFEVQVRPDQEDLVDSVVKSLAEAWVYHRYAWPRLICDGDEVVGFLMAFFDIPWSPERDPHDRRSGLWRLNIAAEQQGRGYGRFAVEAVCDEVYRRGGSQAYVTWKPRPGGPEPFYLRLGFRPTGETSDGETVAVRDI
ncbi:GNAT family N-acetyltransferase [Cryptosporangium sp. NPDC051539]|uniref:GNAT family N-acetyltransferase n=1 Tax=Cryptosporangium sp. NPDC051539 TaxID=3363962 RepID=UPI00379B49EA